MRFLKSTFIKLATVLCLSTTFFLTSCEEDSCLSLNCQNGGTCAEGFCRCPTGFEGAECEIRPADKFVGVYAGTVTCGNLPRLADTVYIVGNGKPNEVIYERSKKGGETLTGTVTGNRVVFEDKAVPNGTRRLSVMIADKKITAFDEATINGQTQTCSFTGFRP